MSDNNTQGEGNNNNNTQGVGSEVGPRQGLPAAGLNPNGPDGGLGQRPDFAIGPDGFPVGLGPGPVIPNEPLGGESQGHHHHHHGHHPHHHEGGGGSEGFTGSQPLKPFEGSRPHEGPGGGFERGTGSEKPGSELPHQPLKRLDGESRD